MTIPPGEYYGTTLEPVTGRTVPVRIETITIDSRDQRRLRAFGTGVLGYDVAVDQPGNRMVLCDPGGSGPRIGIQVVPEPKVVKGRLALSRDQIEGELEVEIRRMECPGDGGCAPSKTTLTNHAGSCPDWKATSSGAHDRQGNPGQHGGRVQLLPKMVAIR